MRCAVGLLAALLAGCSSEDDAVAPVTTDERRAVAEAQAMIPAGELPTADPTPTESAANDQ